MSEEESLALLANVGHKFKDEDSVLFIPRCSS